MWVGSDPTSDTVFSVNVLSYVYNVQNEILPNIVENHVRMAEWSQALRSGRSPLLWAWVRIPLLTLFSLKTFCHMYITFRMKFAKYF